MIYISRKNIYMYLIQCPCMRKIGFQKIIWFLYEYYPNLNNWMRQIYVSISAWIYLSIKYIGLGMCTFKWVASLPPGNRMATSSQKADMLCHLCLHGVRGKLISQNYLPNSSASGLQFLPEPHPVARGDPALIGPGQLRPIRGCGQPHPNSITALQRGYATYWF